jgi:hypothetical protein
MLNNYHGTGSTSPTNVCSFWRELLKPLKLRDYAALRLEPPTGGMDGYSTAGTITVLFSFQMAAIRAATGEKIMKIRTLVAMSMLTAFVTPAFAADSYYVVQDVKTKKCTITESKPTSTETTVVSGDTVYKTRSEAETGMKSVKVCESH